MVRWIVLFGLLVSSLRAAERTIDFDSFPPNQTPPGFQSALAGTGRPGEWRVVLDDVPSAFSVINPDAPSVSKRGVLAQLSRDPTDERFPILLWEAESFGDFVMSTRFKTMGGAVEQMAGIVFRYQDPQNFYYVRISSLGNNFRFFKVVRGERSAPIGPDLSVPRGVWHELTLECKGNQIRAMLNGKEVLPALTDTSFSVGKVGFWTKSDAVTYFGTTRITYTPLESAAQTALRELMERYPRLDGIAVARKGPEPALSKVVASTRPEEINTVAESVLVRAMSGDQPYYGREKKLAMISAPLRDRNGDVVGAVQIRMPAIKGQTRDNAFARVLPALRYLQERIRTAEDLGGN